MKNNFKKSVYNFLSKFGVKAFYTLFPEYFAKEPLEPTDRYIEYPFVIRNLPKPPAKILDVGCVGSFFPLILASFGYEVFGIDIRNYTIINKIKFNNFRFIKEDIRKATLPDNYFDIVTAISTLEHIGIAGRYGTDEYLDGDLLTMKKITRLLKPAGMALITVPFGKAKIIKPYTRIYDDLRIKRITNNFQINKEEYYWYDESDNWFNCSKETASLVEAKSDKYPLCLLKLIKLEK
ncbi:MAG: hypothetical protein A2166_02750 [Omnitrophica WOR_2 bacterium RBG_13_41_10]|nr:MAG: hypothetical protein A2166_02750 [Omnitrophica WOR_2 bacterium RBG_13_41_10]